MRSGQQQVTHDPSTYIPVVKLTTAELERFRENAPAALARRGAGFVPEQLARIGEHVLTGLVPLVGVLAYDWSVPALVVFLLVGIWTAIVCDIFKYAVLRAAVASEARELEDHRRVWLVVDAMRKEQQEGRAVIAKYPPGVGLFLDVAMGSISTLVLLMGVFESQPQAFGLPFQGLGFVLSLLGFIVYELALTVWIVFHHRISGDCKRSVRIDAGLRGVGLFLLLFLTIGIGSITGASSPDQLSPKEIVLIANGWFILLGVVYGLNLARMRREAAWLRAYLQRGRGRKPRRTRRRT